MSEPRSAVAGPHHAGADRMLIRPRLDHIVDGARVVVAHGPAGSGKTTFLRHHAHRWPGQTAWLECDSLDREPDEFLARLVATLPGQGDDRRIERLTDTMLVIDEVDRLAGSATHTVLDAVVARLPAGCAVAFGTRRLDVLPGLERWRVGHHLVQVSSNDLRFRLWEVGCLFRECYGHDLAVEEVHQVSSASGGWAVALRYCGVALRQAAPEDRAHLIASLGRSRAQLRRYLRTQVLSTLTSEQRHALRRLAVFDRFDEQRVDALAPELAGQLTDLVATGVLDESGADGMVRMHSLLRTELIDELIAERADARMSDLYLEAAAVLERLGQTHEASVARSRAGGPRGSLQSNDVLAVHGAANRALVAGDVLTARTHLQAAVERFEEAGGSSVARRQLQQIDAWLGTPGGTPTTWVAAVRRALDGDRFGWTGQHETFVEAVRSLVGGDVQRARTCFADAEHASPDGFVRLLAGLGAGISSLLSADHDDAVRCGRRTWERCCDDGKDALALVAEALMLSADGSTEDLDTVRAIAKDREDLALHGIVTLITAEARPMSPIERVALLESAADTFNRVGMRALGHRVASRATHHRPASLRQPESLAEGGPPPRQAETAAAATLHIRCLGDLEVTVNGRVLDQDGLRPLHRELLAILCSRAGSATHSEELADLLWPERSFEAAKPSLHTAVSALRSWFADGGDPLGRKRIVRRGGAYVLSGDAGDTDVGALSAACHRLTNEIRRGDAGIGDLTIIVETYTDEPFRAFGPVDWAVSLRHSVRAEIDGLFSEAAALASTEHDRELVTLLHARTATVGAAEMSGSSKIR